MMAMRRRAKLISPKRELPLFLQIAIPGALISYIIVCSALIARKHGKSPYIYGLLSVVSPINLIILGYWAFSDYESDAWREARGD
ncbi:MAG TPA: hypothetical protein VGK02_03500 [Candidatus Aquicultor sp.]|jgi:hypothetical protein